MANQQLSTNTFGVAKWIVSADATQGTHTTIAGALTAASSGDTILIRDGTYTENPTLKNGVNLSALNPSAANGKSNVTIVGKMIDNGGAVTCNLYGISFQTNSDYILSATGTGVITFNNCDFIISNNTALFLNNSSISVNLVYCSSNFTTINVTLATVTSGNLNVFGSVVANSGSSTTQTSIAAGQIAFYYSELNIPFITSSTGIITFDHCSIFTFVTNSTALVTAGSGTSSLTECTILTGSASSVSVGTGTTVNAWGNTVNSTNTNAFTGLGTIVHSGTTFANTGKGINTSTITPKSFRSGLLLDSTGSSGTTSQVPVATTSSEFTWGTVPVAGGGTGAITLTGLLTGNGTSAITGTAITQYNVLTAGASNAPNSVAPSATSGIPLISQGSSAQPIFGTAVVAGGGTGVATLTGLALGSGTSAFTGVTYTAKSSFTPVLNFGGGTTGITYSNQVGTYQRIGSLLFFSIYIILSSKGSSTGQANITGMPVAAADYSESVFLTVSLTLTATNLYAYYEIQPTGTTLTLFQGTITGTQSNLQDTNFGNSSQLWINGLYFV